MVNEKGFQCFPSMIFNASVINENVMTIEWFTQILTWPNFHILKALSLIV